MEASSPSKIPSRRESKPVLPKPQDNKSGNHDDDEDSFEFHSGGKLQRTADELFDGGKIKPLKPLPDGLAGSLESPINAKNLKELLSPRNKKTSSYSSVTELYVLSLRGMQNPMSREDRNERERGRERTYSSSRRQRGITTRSLSPFKVSESCRRFSNPLPVSKAKDDSSCKKWKLRDLWLSNESNEQEVLKKYPVMKKSGGEDVKESIFGSTESGGGVRRKGVATVAVSAHERHYAAKKAAVEEMRRKTVLPYKHGLLGCMGFNFNPIHEISNRVAHTCYSVSDLESPNFGDRKRGERVMVSGERK